MSHTSSATYLVWSILSTFLGIFLLHHLWRFDRFRCLKWSSGPYSGAFKRIMTYTYLMTIPLISIYTYAFAYMKYNLGYVYVPGIGSLPTPYQLWPQSYQNMIFPLTLVFSLGWACELVTHLEELCFWFFLVNAGPTQPDWFRSKYFKVWAVGAVIALTVMPLATSLTRHNPLQSEAATFLTGSIGGLALTLCFIPILYSFPAFLRKIKTEGVDTEVLIRLTKFYELNVIRIVFRFLFVIPFLILGSDGVRPHVHVNDNLFATDFLAFVGSMGCVVSSTITLLIFFPRSYADEVKAQDASFHHDNSVNSYIGKTSKRTFSRSGNAASPTISYRRNWRRYRVPSPNAPRSRHETQDSHITRDSYLLTDSPVPQASALPFIDNFNMNGDIINTRSNPDTIPENASKTSLSQSGHNHHPWTQPSVESMDKPQGLDTYEFNQLHFTYAAERKASNGATLTAATPHPGTGFPNLGYVGPGPFPSALPTTLPMSSFSSLYMDAKQDPTKQGVGARAGEGVVVTLPMRPLNQSLPGTPPVSSGLTTRFAANVEDPSSRDVVEGKTVLTYENLHRHTVTASTVNPLVHNFTSPLDFYKRPNESTSRSAWP